MFGLSLSRRVIQGPAVRSWNSITHFANLLWCKLNYTRNSIMPRSRRRYHSRSRSRSRSHSYDRGREVKRRRIESGDNSPYRRSLSPEDTSTDDSIKICDTTMKECTVLLADCGPLMEKYLGATGSTSVEYCDSIDSELNNSELQEENEDNKLEGQQKTCDTTDSELNNSESHEKNESNIVEAQQQTKSLLAIPLHTPKKSSMQKPLTPKQQQKLLERQKLNDAKLAEKQQKHEEKLKIKQAKQEKEEQKQKEKQEKKELKQKEMEEKQKEKELKDEQKEQKKKEREEKDEQKRKEKEEKLDLKRKELEEKEKEKQKQKRVSAMFVNFFKKKTDLVLDEQKCDNVINTNFMPFKIKVDMKLAPLNRRVLTTDEKGKLVCNLQNDSTVLYLEELKCGKTLGKSTKTWPFESIDDDDDVVLIDDSDIGQSVEDVEKTQTFRAKLLKFHENRRPPYFGTWRKKSTLIKPRKPLGIDKKYFDYEIDTDDEWEEEDSAGESLRGSDDEDKENEGDNDYEVDNDFFVPHGHLSDDELNEEETGIESPEAHKAKLKLLKKEFEEEMKGQTHRMKGRVIGCVWEKKHNTIDDAIHNFLKPFAIICKGPIVIKKRNEIIPQIAVLRKSGVPGKPLSVDLIPTFLKFIHGKTNKMSSIINEFILDLSNKSINTEVSKASLKKQAREFAEWIRNPDIGPMHQKYCWYVNKDMQEKYNLRLEISS